MVTRCDNCGRRVRRPYRLDHFQGRQILVCGRCLQRIVRGMVDVDRVIRAAHDRERAA